MQRNVSRKEENLLSLHTYAHCTVSSISDNCGGEGKNELTKLENWVPIQGVNQRLGVNQLQEVAKNSLFGGKTFS